MNKNDFYEASRATWQACARPSREPDYVSLNKEGEISSEYWYTSEGVYRSSNHWSRVHGPIKYTLILDEGEPRFEPTIVICGRIKLCWWILIIKEEPAESTIPCGFCRWDKFRNNII